MSYIHHIIGGPNAAADYEEYLERLRAHKRARRNAESGNRREAMTFDSPIDPDQDSDRDQNGGTDGEEGDKPGGDAEGKQGWSAVA